MKKKPMKMEFKTESTQVDSNLNHEFSTEGKPMSQITKEQIHGSIVGDITLRFPEV